MLGAELLPLAFWPRLRWPFSLVATASESRLIRPAVKCGSACRVMDGRLPHDKKASSSRDRCCSPLCPIKKIRSHGTVARVSVGPKYHHPPRTYCFHPARVGRKPVDNSLDDPVETMKR